MACWILARKDKVPLTQGPLNRDPLARWVVWRICNSIEWPQARPKHLAIGKTPITQTHVGQMCHEGVAYIGDMDIVSRLVGVRCWKAGRSARQKAQVVCEGSFGENVPAMRNEARNVVPKMARTVVEICEIS